MRKVNQLIKRKHFKENQQVEFSLFSVCWQCLPSRDKTNNKP